MRAGIIGAGRVGCSLALALSKKGLQGTGVYGRNAESVRIILEGQAVTAFERMDELVKNCDTIFITVPDQAISEVARLIVQSCNSSDLTGKTFLHCSGALASGVLSCIRETGGFTGSLHPIQTFPDKTNSWESMYNIFFGFEGTSEAEATAEKVVSLLEGRILRVNTEGKSLYHAAACILSNYMVALSYSAGQLLEGAGINADIGLKAFAPLVRSTVGNIERLGNIDALTGPISRGDTDTVEAHLDAMEGKFPDAAMLYRSLGRATVALALEKGTIKEERARELIQLLGKSK